MIDISDLNFSYSKNKNTLTNINLKINEGEIIGLTGESGCGKTTLAKIICGLLSPNEGKINIQLKNAGNSKVSPIQILFQNDENLINPNRIVEKMLSDLKFNLIDKKTLFNLIGISDKILARRGYELSGGERQKVGLARIMLANPKLLILDEPFSAQDIQSNKNFIELFKKIHNTYNTTILVISHAIFSLKDFCTKMVIMKEGKIIEINNTTEIFESSKKDYTKYLINSALFKKD